MHLPVTRPLATHKWDGGTSTQYVFFTPAKVMEMMRSQQMESA